MAGASESDSAQPERAESTVPTRYTIESLANAFDVLRRFAEGDAAGIRNEDKSAADAPSHPDSGDQGGQ